MASNKELLEELKNLLNQLVDLESATRIRRRWVELPTNSYSRVSGGNNSTVITASNNTDGVLIHNAFASATNGNAAWMEINGEIFLKARSGNNENSADSDSRQNIVIPSGNKIEIFSSGAGAESAVNYEVV